MSFLVSLVHSLDDYMLGIILAPLGQADKARVVRELMEAFASLLLKYVAGLFKIRVRFESSGGGSTEFLVT